MHVYANVCDSVLHCSWNKSLLWVSKKLLWVPLTAMEWNNVTEHTIQQGLSHTKGDIFFCCLRGQLQPELCNLLWPSLFPLLSCTIKSAIYGRREHLIMIYLEKACPRRFWRLLCLCLLCKRGKRSLMTAGRELLFVALGIHTAVCLSSAYYSL